jgi:PhnB protein
MEKNTKPIPDGYHTVTPSITVDDAAGALAFYAKAFGAEELMRMAGPGGKIMHAEFKVGNSHIMMQDEMPEMRNKSAKNYGGSPVSFYVYVADVDAAWKRATHAGAKTIMPVEDMFWGDRMGAVQDPYGLTWKFAQRTRDVSPEEMKKGQEAFAQRMQHATN